MNQFTRTLLALIVVLMFVCSLTAGAQGPAPTNEDSLAKFAGTWQGKCQDGRTFVVLNLQSKGDQMAGAISIANMHGDDEGACLLVKDPPTPEHALTISQAVAQNGVLSFRGPQRASGKSLGFELKEKGRGQAELKVLDTPVEDHPWTLVKVEKPE